MIYYVYPMWHRVSFSMIAKKHVEQLRKYYRVYEIDELALRHMSLASSPIMILHPYFFPLKYYGQRIERIRHKVKALIGIDVADSDHISNVAVSMTHYSDAMVVPSTWAKEAYIRSGVRVPVYVVPHGVDRYYFERKTEGKYFHDLRKLKEKKNLKFLLYFCWHSEYRKGFDLVIDVYRRLLHERKDVVLVTKLMSYTGLWQDFVRRYGGIIVAGWLNEEQKLLLYDLCDVYLLFSRGGGFELNGLEALARGEVVLAADQGSWTDYLPSFCLIPSRSCPYVLKDNPIHDGKGVEIIVNKAVDKICEVLDDLEEYKTLVREYVSRRIRHEFTWEAVGRKLANIIRTIGSRL